MPTNTNNNQTHKNNEKEQGFKQFRQSSEVEQFYRFVADNNIREEAKKLVQLVLSSKKSASNKSRKKAVKLN